MTSPIARCGGNVLEQRGQQLVIVDQGTGWTFTTRFVIGLLGGIAGGNAVVLAATAIGNRSLPMLGGAGALGLFALLLAAVFVAIGRYRTKAEGEAGYAVMTIDLQQGALLAPDGRPIAPIAHLSTRRAFQLTSSSRALELCWPGGSIEIAEGNPFGDSVDGIEAGLQRFGVRRA